MNILFITPSIPSRLHRIRSYDFIRVLAKKHKVHLLSFDSENINLPEELSQSVATFDRVYKSKWKSYIDCFIYLFSYLPLEVSYCKSKEMKIKVNEIIRREKIDLVYIKRLRSYQFIDNLTDPIPVVVDTTDAMSLFYKRAFANASFFKKFLFFEEYIKYLIYEKIISSRNKNWITCSDIDANYLRNKFGDLNIAVIPNIVDIDFFKNPDPYGNHLEEKSILFSGLMNKYVNIEGADFFVKKVFPKIISKYHNAKLYIVGPNPTKHIKEFQSDNIVVTGFVSDIREYLKKAEIVVCPIITGTGVRNKILQAWSMNKPVVSTTAGWSGLTGEDGKDLIIANDPESFAKSIINLFEDKQSADFLSKNGRKLVELIYSESAIINKIEIFFKELLLKYTNGIIIKNDEKKKKFV